MRYNRSQLLLPSLLALYVAARVLQLFAGRIPSLFIVSLHVVPAALFSLIHGSRVYGLRGILIFMALCLGIGSAFESLSLRTGFPFGHYAFTEVMGPKLFDLPILLALAYVGMGYVSWILGLTILGYRDQPLSGRRAVYLALVASFVMVTWDLSMDPVWADIDHAWIWLDGGPYFGVPVTNYFGWFLTVYIFYQCFALYLKHERLCLTQATFSGSVILFYGVSAAGNLLAIAPPSLGTSFVDASGKQWLIGDILWASRVVSLLVMLPFSLIAWARTLESGR
jgi:putative membrane protein